MKCHNFTNLAPPPPLLRRQTGARGTGAPRTPFATAALDDRQRWTAAAAAPPSSSPSIAAGDVLEAGGAAAAAVAAAIQRLEAARCTNAGDGSNLTEAGTVEVRRTHPQ